MSKTLGSIQYIYVIERATVFDSADAQVSSYITNRPVMSIELIKSKIYARSWIQYFYVIEKAILFNSEGFIRGLRFPPPITNVLVHAQLSIKYLYTKFGLR
jgi:hypothetical protein